MQHYIKWHVTGVRAQEVMQVFKMKEIIFTLPDDGSLRDFRQRSSI